MLLVAKREQVWVVCVGNQRVCARCRGTRCLKIMHEAVRRHSATSSRFSRTPVKIACRNIRRTTETDAAGGVSVMRVPRESRQGAWGCFAFRSFLARQNYFFISPRRYLQKSEDTNELGVIGTFWLLKCRPRPSKAMAMLMNVELSVENACCRMIGCTKRSK
jgi:hypothetical protein